MYLEAHSDGISRRTILQLAGTGAAASVIATPAPVLAQQGQGWDKTFAKSEMVDHRKVTFRNRYGITLFGDLCLPRRQAGTSLSALAVCGPFGEVKEQASGLHAQTLAERGFATLAFDPSLTGESGGLPRNVTSSSASIWGRH